MNDSVAVNLGKADAIKTIIVIVSAFGHCTKQPQRFHRFPKDRRIDDVALEIAVLKAVLTPLVRMIQVIEKAFCFVARKVDLIGHSRFPPLISLPYSVIIKVQPE